MEALMHGSRIACSSSSHRSSMVAASSSRPCSVVFSSRTSGACGKRRRGRLIVAMDAAQAFDYESRKMQETRKKQVIPDDERLKIGILGFGNFGQFMAKRFVEQGHHVLAHSRSDYCAVADSMGVSYFRDADDFCEEHPEIVLLCTSILSTENVLRSLPLQRLKRNTLFVDVLSVKYFPKALFMQVLPQEFDILCTHPMFGPESGKETWDSLPFVYEEVRVRRQEACRKFLDVFRREGCRMVEMNCSEHDRYAASSQFITHTVGRMLGKLQLESTPINTKGYETLLNLVQNTEKDSFDLYYGLFMYNENATEELERLELAFDSLKKQLFGQLHNVLRKQLFTGLEQQQQSSGDASAKALQLSLPFPPVAATSSLESERNGNNHASSSENGYARNIVPPLKSEASRKT